MFLTIRNLPYFLVLVINYTESSSVGCGLHQYTLIMDNDTRCIDCHQCPQGMGSVPGCGAFLFKETVIGCQTCTPGVSFSNSYGEQACKPCTACLDKESIVKPCTPTSNTVCGTCTPGYYRSLSHLCEKCSPCCNDNEVGNEIQDECIAQGMAANSSCVYTGRTCSKTSTSSTSLGTVVLATTLRTQSSDELRVMSEQTTLKSGTAGQQFGRTTLKNEIDNRQWTKLEFQYVILLAVCLLVLVSMCICLLCVRLYLRNSQEKKRPVMHVEQGSPLPSKRNEPCESLELDQVKTTCNKLDIPRSSLMTIENII